MNTGTIYYVGTEQEVSHHAQPLSEHVAIRIAAPQTVVDEARPGDLAIFFSEHFDRFRLAIPELRCRRVATLYAIDGILEWRNAWENRPDEVAAPWTMRPVLSDKVACIGEAQARVLRSWGNGTKVEVVGVPRFDRLVTRANPDDGMRQDVFRLLVMTAKFPGFTPQQREQMKKSLFDLKSWVERNPMVNNRRLEVVWRLTGGLDQGLGIENQLVDTTGLDLATVLQSVDAVVTTPSTAQIEAMLMEIPTAVLDYTNSPLYVDAAWRMTAGDQFQSTITELCAPSARRMHYQQCVLRDNLQMETDATERMLSLIHQMMEESHAAAQADRAPEFARPLLPALAGEPAVLSLPNCFQQTSAFALDDDAIVRSQLADAQRKIERLYDVIDGLRGELDQAHEIFEAINRHPIAGPVVRTRKVILDWLAKAQTDLASSK